MSHSNNIRRGSTLTKLVVAVFIIGALIYQYLSGQMKDQETDSQPATTSIVTVQAESAGAGQTLPTVTPKTTPAGAGQTLPTVTPKITPAGAGQSEPAVSLETESQSGQFDFYVLALSWSPDYCTSSGDDDPQQCSLGKKLGFVLHGLWPQYNKGYPGDCSTQKLPQDIKSKFPGLYPSQKLYDHEWEKHGTCSSLTPEQYLSLSKRLKEGVVIPGPYRAPEQPVRVTTSGLKAEFVAANPGLDDSALAVYCSGSGRFLKELFVCFSKGGKYISCSQEIHQKASRSCQQPDLLVRNVR